MLEKLKHEWKTVAWGVASGAVELYDQVFVYQMDTLAPIVPPEHQWIVHVMVPIGFFALRRWTDVDSNT